MGAKRLARFRVGILDTFRFQSDRNLYHWSHGVTFIHSPRLTVLASGMLCFLAGLVADRYVDKPGHVVWLSLFILFLVFAAWIMNGLIRKLQPEREIEVASSDKNSLQGRAIAAGSIRESVELSKSAISVGQSVPIMIEKAPAVIQQSLDFDGIGALRALDQITGNWLVSDASEPAADLIRTACLQTVEGGATELERAGRWFDIADSLRSKACRSLPKAELRRSYVADTIGVGQEQVRQIDQGRYAPLNKLLSNLDPKSLSK